MSQKKIIIILVSVTTIMLGSGGSVNADFTFGTPTNLGPPVNTQYSDGSPNISPDGLSFYFQSGRLGGSGGPDLWMSTRKTQDDNWGTPMNLGSTVNSSADDWAPSISPDGLELFFTSKRPGGPGGFSDIWLTTRATLEDDWGEPEPLGPNINTSGFDGHPSISSDGLELYFCCWDDNVDRSGGYGTSDIWVTSRLSLSDPWAEPVNLGATVNSSAFEGEQDISADGLCLFFSGDRPGGSGGWDLWVTTRKTKEDPWDDPVNLGPEINSSGTDAMADVSEDGSMLFFASDRSGEDNVFDIWQVPIIPIVDLNGNGIVDSADMCVMVDHWGTDNSLCDIGPMPWGDGIVDVEDLKVLAEHLFEEVFPIELIEYWKLDEDEGDIAYNSTSDNHGVLSGNPIWQPNAGQIAGALEFDGIDDYISTDFVLNPADGVFSLFAWIKDGAPGDVIVSQQGAANLLATDAEGNLMTELKGNGRSAGPLFSETIIADGQWHCIGLVWDGSYRHLYMDVVEVTTDYARLSDLMSFDSGLYLGSGSSRDPETFFSGLIDDVRIYNKALSLEEIAALAQ